jgi:hypothetical protein
MRCIDIEAGGQLDSADGSIEREIMAQSVLGVETDIVTEVLPDDDFVPGFYQIMPMIRRSPVDGDAGHESAHFHRPRHHKSVPDRLIAGMFIQPPASLDQLGMS